MPRFELQGSPINVAYGFDDQFGTCDYFLSVYDERLQWEESASKEVNKIAEMVGVKDGGGSYFDLHTGPNGFGFKVDKNTMAVYMKRFGIPDKHIESVMKLEPMSQLSSDSKNEPKLKLDSDQLCSNSTGKKTNLIKAKGKVCKICEVKNSSKTCSNCKVMSYCSAECQVKDWPVHKFFCKCLPFPPRVKTSNKTVRGVFLPEATQDPILVNIVVLNKFLEEDGEKYYFECPDLKEFLGGGIYGRNQMPLNPLKNERKFYNTIEFHYRENFLNDGSKQNKTIQKISGNRHSHDWRGPVIVTKYSGQGAEGDYLDIKLEDFSDIIDYLIWYGTSDHEYVKHNINYR